MFLWHDADEIEPCADCGDDIEVGEQVCWEPDLPGSKLSVLVHDYCAVRNGYRLDLANPDGLMKGSGMDEGRDVTTTAQAEPLVDAIQKALAWVGYNSPNSSDYGRALLALQAGDRALAVLEARLSRAEAVVEAARAAQRVIHEDFGAKGELGQALRDYDSLTDLGPETEEEK